MYDVFAEFNPKAIYRYFDDKLPLLMRILHRPQPRLVNTFAAHLHRYCSGPTRLQFDPADADNRGGDFAVRLEDEFPAAFFCLPRADEKIGKLLNAVNGDLDTIAGRTSAAGIRDSEKNTKQQQHESFHKINFRRPRDMLQ